jgi:hypothetical protein
VVIPLPPEIWPPVLHSEKFVGICKISSYSICQKNGDQWKKMCIYWNLRHSDSEHPISLVFSLSGLAFLKQFVKNGDDFLATYQLIISTISSLPKPSFLRGRSIYLVSKLQAIVRVD